jgi:hypothetical protein
LPKNTKISPAFRAKEQHHGPNYQLGGGAEREERIKRQFDRENDYKHIGRNPLRERPKYGDKDANSCMVS